MRFNRSRATRTTVVTALAVCLVISASVASVAAARAPKAAPKPPAAPTITVKASTAQPGGRINLNVGIKTSGKVGAASASAVAAFATGDVSARLPKVVKLKNGAALTGTVLVPAAELPGPMTVRFTVVYAGVTYVRTATTTVEPLPTPTPTPAPTEAPVATETPVATAAPTEEPVPTAAPTEEPVPTP